MKQIKLAEVFTNAFDLNLLRFYCCHFGPVWVKKLILIGLKILEHNVWNPQ